MIGQPVRQIAYFVADVRTAALEHRTRFGSGPFIVSEHIALTVSLHRGRPTPLDHTSAYGQWGKVMVEFVQQNNPDPSCFHDLFPPGRWGLHHTAVFVDDVKAEIARWAALDREAALYAELANGMSYAMIDLSADLGHMLEIYPPVQPLLDFYAFIEGVANPEGEAFLNPA